MRKRIIPLVVIAVVLAAGLYYYFEVYRPQAASRANFLSGHIEATEVDLAFRLPGHLSTLAVEEGDVVRSGQALAALETELYQLRVDQAEAKVAEVMGYLESLSLGIEIRQGTARGAVDAAAASVKSARANVSMLEKGSREEEIRAAQAAMNAARADADRLGGDLKRGQALFERHVVSEAEFEAVRAASQAAQARYLAAREQYLLVKAGPRSEQVTQGRAALSGQNANLDTARAAAKEVEKLKLDRRVVIAQLAQAEAALGLARRDLAAATLKAPFSGVVSLRSSEPGEYLQPGAPVLTLARLDEVWVNTYVPETELGRVKLSQKAVVKNDTFPEKEYPGQVVFISPEAEFTPKNVQTREERVKLVYRVKVRLANPDFELKVGMPVEVFLR